MKKLMKDPTNMVIVGVAGQGNVVTSLLLCNTMVEDGYQVTFGQTYPAQQRAGTVTNYVRISEKETCSPIIPEGCADVVVAMEPVEAVRMLGTYGNPSTTTIVNTRAIQAVDITGMGAKYPEIDGLLADIRALSGRVLRINATEEAKKLGNALMANVVILGVIAGANVVPLERSTLEPIIKERFPKAFEKNMAAFDRGVQLANG